MTRREFMQAGGLAAAAAAMPALAMAVPLEPVEPMGPVYWKCEVGGRMVRYSYKLHRDHSWEWERQ